MFRQSFLEEKHVVVTGGAGRFGRLLVNRFLDAGAAVSVVVRSGREVDIAGDRETLAVFEADLCDEDHVREAFRMIDANAGSPDILVHAAGGWAETPLLETSLAEWNSLISTNLTSTFLCFREASRLMRGRQGRLIAIAAAQGADRGQPRQSGYSASKAGVVRLVEAVDAEFRNSDIRAFAVAPSFIAYDNDPAPGVSARDLADLCLYLASDAAAGLSGSVIRAYGDRR